MKALGRIARTSLVLLLLPFFGAQSAAEASATSPHIDRYYLALGDSFAFGYRPDQADAELSSTHTIDPATFDTGYADDLAHMLNVVLPNITYVNLACPGETTQTFTTTFGCPWLPLPLHTESTGSQMDEALAFLHRHPHQVALITIDLGLSDVIDVTGLCKASGPACPPGSLADSLTQVQTNLPSILVKLHQAAPDTLILVPEYPSPFASTDPEGDATIDALNAVIVKVAGPSGALALPASAPDSSSPPLFCVIGPSCGSGTRENLHPTTGGYALMADELFQSSGYTVLGNETMVGFDSAIPGTGRLLFGSTCTQLLGSATMDMHPGTTTHDVLVTVNDLPEETGVTNLSAGASYAYQTVTVGVGRVETDTNKGQCYAFTNSFP